MIVYLFLPKNSKPPYQAIIDVPGADGFGSGLVRMLFTVGINENYYLKDGRAFIEPVYYGTFEREKDTIPGLYNFDYGYYFSFILKDVRRTIDYLETRSDIDITKLAVLGSKFRRSHGINGSRSRRQVEGIYTGYYRSLLGI